MAGQGLMTLGSGLINLSSVMAQQRKDEEERKRQAQLDADDRAKTALNNEYMQQTVSLGRSKIEQEELNRQKAAELMKKWGLVQDTYQQDVKNRDTFNTLNQIHGKFPVTEAPEGTSTDLYGTETAAGLEQAGDELRRGQSDIGRTRVDMMNRAGGLQYAGETLLPAADNVYKTIEAQDKADADAYEREQARQFNAEQKELDRQSRADMFGMSQGNRQADNELKLSQRDDQRTVDRFTSFAKYIDPSNAPVRSALGQAKNGFERAERLESLAKAFEDGNQLRDAELEELAIGLNSMLSGGAVGARSQVEALVPKTAIGDAQKLRQFLSNNPTGMNQKAFVDRITGTIVREKNTMYDQMKRAQYGRIIAYKDLEEKDPEKFNDVLLSQGIDPDEYFNWKATGSKSMSAVQAPESAGGEPAQATEPRPTTTTTPASSYLDEIRARRKALTR